MTANQWLIELIQRKWNHNLIPTSIYLIAIAPSSVIKFQILMCVSIKCIVAHIMTIKQSLQISVGQIFLLSISNEILYHLLLVRNIFKKFRRDALQFGQNVKMYNHSWPFTMWFWHAITCSYSPDTSFHSGGKITHKYTSSTLLFSIFERLSSRQKCWP